MATSAQPEALTIDSKRLASIAYHVVGVHTEGGPTPYTGAANAGGASGLSIGTMQHDFGQRPATAPTYASAVVDWYASNDRPISFTASQLATGILKKTLTSEQRAATAEFGASDHGAKWIYDNLEKPHVDAAVEAAQRAFATPYGQAVLAQETHIEEFAAFSMKVFNQYGGGPPTIKGEVSDYKFPGFQGLLAYLNRGQVELRDNRIGHDGETISVEAKNPEQFDREDLLAFSRGYASTRSNQRESNSPTLGDNRAAVSGPQSALNSGALYSAILDSDSPLSDVLRRVEAKGDFSPILVTTDVDVALARAMFGADTGRMKSAVTTINDATTLDPVSVSITLGQYHGTLWIEPLSGRAALSYKNSTSGFVVDANGHAKFATSSVAKDEGVRTLQIGEGDTAVSFDQVATPLANSQLPREISSTPAPAVSIQGANNIAPTSLSSTVPVQPTNHITSGAIYLSRDGASATLPDGRVINADPGEKLGLDVDGNLSVTRSVSGYRPEDAVYSVTLYKRSGQVIAGTQIQVVADPAHPNDPAYSTTVTQGQERDITQIQPDGLSTTIRTVFQTGFGWIEQATGEVVQTVAEWAQERSAQASAQRSGSSDSDTDAQSVFRRLELEQQNGAKEEVVTSQRALSPEELRAFETGLAQAAAAKHGTSYADAGGYDGNTTASDAGGGSDQQAQSQQLIEAKAQASQAASAVGLMNSIIGLQHWGDMSDLQRTAAIASIYNVVDKITENALPGDLGTTTSALGLLNALDKGDVGSLLVSSVSLINALTEDMASKAIGSALGINADDVVPGIGLVLALESGDPMSIAAAAANFIPIYGPFLSVAISVFGDVFGDDPPDIPTREGLAHAQWDTAGNTVVINDQDIEGGGPTATGWMTSMVNGLQAQLANVHDAIGNSYALVPDLLPAIGFVYNPDGYNTGNGTNGFVYLKWTDENGQTQTRYYDGAGNRSDGTDETLTGDFMQHAARAIAPAWAVATTLAHYQQGLGIHLPSAQAGMPQEAVDGIHQTLQAITLALPVEPALQNALIDVDGDEYLERTQWLATNQQVLSIDVDGNNQISVNELLGLGGPDARHSLGWLDANSDQVLTDRDPAFAALRVWMDVNADAESAGETQTLAQAGIVAIDFGSHPPTIVHADGSRQALTVQMLVGDVLGVQYEAVEGGVLQLDEQASGPAAATLHAVNTREFDGQAGHIHGGDADTDGGEETVNAGEERLVTTSVNTVATQSAQTSATLAAGDARLRAGASGNALAGQGTAQTAGTAQVRNNGIVFVPAGSAGVGAQMREATEDMVRSADAGSLAPLAALAAGAAAVQWPTVGTAATSQAQDANAAPVLMPGAQGESARNDLQTWESSRASAAAPISPAQESPQVVTPVTWDAAPRQAGGGATAAAQEPPAPLAWTSPTIIPPVNAANGGVLAATSAPAGDVDGNTSPAASVTAPLASSAHSTSTPLDYPEVHGEQVNSLEDIGLRFLETQLLSNDSTVNAPARPNEPSLHISSVFSPVHGSVLLQTNVQGVVEVVFLPETNYHGPASFDYTVTDQYGLSSNARVSLTIAAVNDAPVTQNGNASGVEDTVLDFAPGDLLGGASDVDTVTDRQQLSVRGIVAAQHGVAVLMPDGRIRFTPQADYDSGIDGPASFTYNVSDSAGGVTPMTMWVSLAPVNDAPRLQDESTDTLEDQALNINTADLLANVFDVDDLHADLRISAVSDAIHGSVVLQAQPDGGTRIVFTPEGNFHGIASFRYTVTDPSGASSAATARVVVAAVNDAPVTQDSQVSGTEDTAIYFMRADLLANASDVDAATDGQQVAINAIASATHGVATLMPDGLVRFTPDADYHHGIAGPASFTYSVTDGAGGVTPATVRLSLAAVNDAPRLQDESANTLEDQALSINTIDLLANDSDVDDLHADLRISSVGDAVHGSVALQAQPDGSTRIVFTPEGNFHGIASFRYTATDPSGASSTATTQVMVAAVNDAPVTQDGNVSSVEDTVLEFAPADLLASANDPDAVTDGQQLSISAITAARHGVAVLMPDGRIRFTPDADYNAGIDGPASFTYSVSDNAGGVTPATVWVSLAARNDAPDVQDEFTRMLEDEVFSVATADLLANDSDIDDAHADLRISAVGNAVHGSVAIQAQPDGSSRIVFTPDANYHGQASFDYTVTDPDGQSSHARVNLDIAAVEDAPVTQDGNVSSTEDTALYFANADLLASASDADSTTDNQQLSISGIVGAQHGVAVLLPDGRVRFTPDADYHHGIAGPASFTYSVTDGAGGVTPATVWVSLAAANDAPRLQGESTSTQEDQALRIDTADLLVNDFDVDNLHSELRVSAVSDAAHGSVALQVQPDGSSRIVFVPNANFHGTASFNYTVTDTDGASSTATARVVVGAVNDAPVTQDSRVSGTEDTAVYFTQADLLANACDVDTATDNQQMSFNGIIAAQHGVAVLMPDGRIRFTPDADYHAGIDGPASFTYSVSDGAGGVTPATVWVSLAAINDAPRLQDETTDAVEDQALSMAAADLLANDFDVDDLHAALRITAVSDAAHGNVALEAQPDDSTRVVFTPAANYHGIASFRYTVTDPDGASSTATVQLVVAAINDAPVTQDSQVSGTEDTVVYFTSAELLASASDVDTATDNQQLSVSAVLAAQNGVATLMPDGRVRFIPDADYNQGIGGLASFTYGVSDGAGGVTPATVWVSLAAVNDAPRLQDETVNAVEDQVLSIDPADLLANDGDVDNLHADLRISAVSDATHGSVALQAQPDGSTRIVFTAEENFHGIASFRYTVTDPSGASSTATTQIAVATVNDAPVTQDIQVSGTEDTAVYVMQADLLANASDVDTVTDNQQLFISAILAARHGVAVFAPDGRIRFTPDADYNASIDGPASFTYGVSDGAGGVTPATVWVSLAAVNDAPRLQDESANTLEDQALSIDPSVLLANDGDVDDLHADLRISAVSDAVHGSVILQAQPDGSTRIVFTPEGNFHSIASFRYTVTDPSGASSTATTQVVVAAVNDAPVTHDRQVSGTEDTAVYFTQADLLVGASDADIATDNQHLSVTAIVAANHGVATLMPDGRVCFTPDADYNQGMSGLASFTYSVSDGAGGVTPATVWLSLAAVNDAPRLQDESANALEDQVLSIATADLLANDSDVDDPRTNLRISAVGDATHGSVALQAQADGSSRVIFTPEENYHGTASFRYTVTDSDGASSMTTARVVLAAVNDVPVSQDGNVSGVEDMALYFANADLLATANDPDIATDNQQLFISAITATRHGVAVLMPDGRIRFTPDADYNAGIDGPASFSYSVSDGAGGVTPATVWVSLAAINDAPRLQDETTNALEDQVLSISTANLLANDSDVDDPQTSLRISTVSDAVHGSVALQAQPDGSTRIVFTAEANYHDIASFHYTVTDPGGASSVATARIALAAVNDAPATQGETASGNEDTALLYTAASLLANDSDVDTLVDGDVLRITRVGLAEHGQVFLQADGSVRFEPEANYNGPAKFSYWVGDRTPAQIATGAGYETVATVNLTILAVNDFPVVTGETMSSNEDIVLNINPALLLANDTDVDTAITNAEPAQVLSITAVGNAQHGSIALLANGTLQFTPQPNYFGTAGFSYTVSDGRGGQMQGQVALNLAAANDAPTVLGETVSFNEDQIQTFTQAQFLSNDSDVDTPQSDLHIVSVENATHGVVSLSSNGSIRFASDADYFGPAQFTYTVSDGAGGFTVGLASLDITPVNDAPRLTGETATLNEDTQARFAAGALLANDTDVDNANLLVTAVGNASHGSVQIAAGEIVFTPDLNYSGPASFTYTVSDSAGGSTQATVNLTFNAVNDAPVVNNELVWGKRSVSYTLTQAALLANDTDVESPAASLRISGISNAQHGSAVLNADGSVRFTPEAGYAGRGSFDYVVRDLDGATSTATAQIDFSRANVNPTATDDNFTGYEDIPFSITQVQLLVNDSDTDNAASDLRVTAVGSASNGTVSLQVDGSVRFVPSADFYGTASFGYLVSDGDGGQTWATARLNVQSVNDAPIIDDIIFGRPVYGYLTGAYAAQDIAIYDEAQALALAGSEQLYSRTYRTNVWDQEGYTAPIYDYALAIPTYYRNGHMRPVFVETQDATYQDPYNLDKWMFPGDGTRPIDDFYRQNGYIVAYDPDGNSAAISFSIAGGPQHGHAWANQYTALSTPRDYSYAVSQWYAVGQTGAWQYYSQRGDPYTGVDPFTMAVTDGGGATTYVTVNTAHMGSFAPVALDLNGGGVRFLGLDESGARFDIDQKGGREHLAWVASGDALLARDIGSDKLIDRSDEISFTGYLPGAQTDLEGLVAFDSNQNQMLDRWDEKWNEFGGWDDKNSNGIGEAGEFRSLDEIGITQIELQSDRQLRQPAQGVTEVGQSHVTWADGHTSAAGDVVLAVAAEPSTPPAVEPVAPPASQTPQAMALQMVHLIATATAEWERMREGGPLGTGCSEIHGPQNVQEAMAATQAEWEQSAQSAFMQWHGS